MMMDGIAHSHEFFENFANSQGRRGSVDMRCDRGRAPCR